MYNHCEITLHVFRVCPRVRQHWSNNVPGNIKQDFTTADINEWIKQNITQSRHWCSFWVVGCQSLWWWRNKEMHDEHFIRPYCPSEYAIRRVEDFVSGQAGGSIVMNVESSLIEVCWKAPDKGWFKHNKDGASNVTKKNCCGGINQNNTGDCVGGF